jgi:hypothetical protein
VLVLVLVVLVLVRVRVRVSVVVRVRVSVVVRDSRRPRERPMQRRSQGTMKRAARAQGTQGIGGD